jgi:hypothetical protein
MAIIYEETQSLSGATIIKADLGNGHLLYIPADEANSDYQRYLRWLEDPEAEENGTIS